MTRKTWDTTRRDFLFRSLSAISGMSSYAMLPVTSSLSITKPKPRIAALVTIYERYTHALHIVDRFLHGYQIHGEFRKPTCEVVSMYVDQFRPGDLSREREQTFGFEIYPTITDALTLGGDTLAVDAILLVGEHGQYDWTDKDMHMYPRCEMYKQLIHTFRKSGRSVPVFNDKHLSYEWDKAAWMYEQSQALNFPFMAGSSLPMTWRLPRLEFPIGTNIEEIVAVHSGGKETSGIHAFEMIQCMAERRRGGETGVKSIQCLEHEAVWKAMEQKVWSPDIFEAALMRSNTREANQPAMYSYTAPGKIDYRKMVKNPVCFLIEYNDGLRASVITLSGLIRDYNFAARLKNGQIQSTQFYLPWRPNVNYFSSQVAVIEKMFHEKRPIIPIERTLLTTGMTIFAMESRFKGYRKLETPQLAIRYQPPEDSMFVNRALY